MSALRQNIAYAFLRAFCAAVWVLTALNMELDDWQKQFLDDPAKRKALCCSRQAGKSTIAAAGALHMACYRPQSLILIVSGSQRQARELFRKVLAFYHTMDRSPDIERITTTELELANGSRIVCLPAKSDTIRGYSGPSLVIIDEAAHVPDDVYFTLAPMLAVSNGELWLCSTPYGKRGFFYEIHQEVQDDAQGYSWKRWTVPADSIPRISDAFLEDQRLHMPEAWFRQEYFCSFEGLIGAVFREEDILAAEMDEVEPLFGEVTRDDVEPVAIGVGGWEDLK